MEQPFKRRRVSLRNDLPQEHATATDNHGSEWTGYKLVKENGAGTHVPLYEGTPIIAPNIFDPPLNKPIPSRKASTRGDPRLSKIRPRKYNAHPPKASVVGSVVQVVVDTGGATLTQTLVPAASSIVSFEGIGRLTVNHNPVISTPLPSSQSDNPYQQSMFSEAPLLLKTVSATATNNLPGGQTSTPSNPQGPITQKILSPQPSTTLRPSPSSSSDSGIVPVLPASSSAHSHALNAASQPKTVELLIPFPSGQNTTMPFLPEGFSTLTTTLSENTQSKSTQAPALTTQSSSHTRPSTTSKSSSISKSTSNTTRKSISSFTHRSSTSSLATSTSLQHSSSTSSSSLASSTGNPENPIGGGGGSGGGATSVNGPVPSSTAASGTGSGSSNTSSTPAVVGGVVGGVAGLALILLLVVFFLRRRRNQGRGFPSSASRTIPPGSVTPGGTTTERSSAVPLNTGGFFGRFRPHSGHTGITTETGPSERGFQNFGGRKLESVLSSRGDGYGDPGPSSSGGVATGPGISPSVFRGPALGHSPGPSGQETLSGSSFYRDSQGFYGGKEAEPGSIHSSTHVGPGSSQTTSPTFSPQDPGGLPPEGVGGRSQRDSGVVVMRPSPARTPVTNQPGFTPLRNPPPPPRSIPADPTQRFPQDQLGRSHPSHDGSRGSRFIEEV